MNASRVFGTIVAVGMIMILASAPASGAEPPGRTKARSSVVVNGPLAVAPVPEPVGNAATPADAGPPRVAPRALPWLEPDQVVRSVQTVGLFALLSLAPAAVLMMTAFVRINIVLILLRQALGSPQVPGNQVLTALALLLTALVMRPTAELVYTQAIQPYASGQATPAQAWEAGTRPIKAFMLDQIKQTNHQEYVWQLEDYVEPPTPGREGPKLEDDFPLRVVAPAYLLSELTTAIVIGFYIYLPFLVIDLVVSAVLAAMGLFMLPPSLVALPLKLILFVAADGWLRIATMLLQSFAIPASG
jgi:flagellar biosynthetic protein FliP